MARRALLAPAVLAALLLFACGGGDSTDSPSVLAINTNSPVGPNSFVRVVAIAESGSVCTLKVSEIQRSDHNDPARSIGPKSPDRNRQVEYRFGVDQHAVLQDFSVTVSCNKNNQTAEGQALIHVDPALKFTPVPGETDAVPTSPTASP